MADPRAFISFDSDNKLTIKNLFVGQIKNSRTPFSAEDWSVSEALPQAEWERSLKGKINRCHLMIVLVGKSMCPRRCRRPCGNSSPSERRSTVKFRLLSAHWMGQEAGGLGERVRPGRRRAGNYSMRVTNWNCSRGADVERFLALMAPLRADLVTLRECRRPASNGAAVIWRGTDPSHRGGCRQFRGLAPERSPTPHRGFRGLARSIILAKSVRARVNRSTL